VVVERALARPWPSGSNRPALAAALRHRHADRAGQARPERAGGDLDALGVVDLRVPGREAAPGAQRLEVGQLQAVAAEVELDVLGQAGVPAGQHEPVAAEPVRVARVVPHDVLVEQVGRGGQAHRGARVAVADLLHGVGGQHPGGVDGADVQVGPPGLASLRAGTERVDAVPDGGSGGPSGPGAWRRRSRAFGAGSAGRLAQPTRSSGRVAADLSVAVTGQAPRPGSYLPDRVTAPSTRAPSSPRTRRAVRVAGSASSSAVRRADQAADHRAAAHHHGAGHGAGRSAAYRRGGWSWPPWSAARCRPAPPTPQLRHRPRHRRAHEPHQPAAPGHRDDQPRAAVVFGSGRCASSRRSWLGVFVNWLSAGPGVWPPSRSTSASTPWCSSAAPRRTSSGAGRPAVCRCSSAGRRSPTRSPGRRGSSSSSSSSGRRRTTGRCR
jgi:hypothetical protein